MNADEFDERRDVCPFAECLSLCAVYDLTTGAPVACLDHFELVLERVEALALSPSLRESLPPLYEVTGQLTL